MGDVLRSDRTGELDVVTDYVQELAGHAATSVSAYMKRSER